MSEVAPFAGVEDNLAGHFPEHPWKIPLTYVVPFGVSLYSSAAERRKPSLTKSGDRDTRPSDR